MLTELPVMKSARSETRNATRSATSSGVPVRPSTFARVKPAAAVALALHDRQHRPDHGEEAEHLVAQLPLQDVERRALDRAPEVGAGIVDEDVEPPERLDRLADE